MAANFPSRDLLHLSQTKQLSCHSLLRASITSPSIGRLHLAQFGRFFSTAGEGVEVVVGAGAAVLACLGVGAGDGDGDGTAAAAVVVTTGVVVFGCITEGGRLDAVVVVVVEGVVTGVVIVAVVVGFGCITEAGRFDAAVVEGVVVV